MKSSITFIRCYRYIERMILRVQQTGKQYFDRLYIVYKKNVYQRVYIRLPRRYLFVGHVHVNRYWGAFAKRCINNRTIRHDAKGAVPIVYCLRKMHFWGSKLHASEFLSWMERFLGTMSKYSCPALLYYMTEGWRLLRWGLGVVPAITYHCNAVPVIGLLELHSEISVEINTLLRQTVTLPNKHAVAFQLHFGDFAGEQLTLANSGLT